MITLAAAFLLSFPTASARDALAGRLAAADLCTVTLAGGSARVECVDRDGGSVLTERWSADVGKFTARLAAAKFRLLGRDGNPPRFYFQR